MEFQAKRAVEKNATIGLLTGFKLAALRLLLLL
jgi:hypothetical protein